MSRLSRVAVLLAASSLVVAATVAGSASSARPAPRTAPADRVDVLFSEGRLAGPTDVLDLAATTAAPSRTVAARPQITAWLAQWGHGWADEYRTGELRVEVVDEIEGAVGLYADGSIVLQRGQGRWVLAHELGHLLQHRHPQGDSIRAREYGADCIAALLTGSAERACSADDLTFAVAVVNGSPLPFDDPRRPAGPGTGYAPLREVTRPAGLTTVADPALATAPELVRARFAAGLIEPRGLARELAAASADLGTAERTVYPGAWAVEDLFEEEGVTAKVAGDRVFVDAGAVRWRDDELAEQAADLVFGALSAAHPGLPACWRGAMTAGYADEVCSPDEFARGVELLAPDGDPRVVAWIAAADPAVDVPAYELARVSLAAAGLTDYEARVTEVGDGPVAVFDAWIGGVFCVPAVNGFVVQAVPSGDEPNPVERADWCAN